MGKAANRWRRWIGERGIDLAELDGSVRRVIFTTYAVLLGLALATALRGFFGTSGSYLAQPGVLIPKAVAWVAGAGAAMAMTLLFAGAAHARTRWKYFLIAPILLAIVVSVSGGPNHVQPPLPPLVKALFLTPLAFFAACVAVVVIGPRLRTRHVLAIMAVLIAAFAATLVAMSARIWSSFAPTALFLGLGIGGFCLYPALLVVGWDLAEIGVEGSQAAMARNANQPLLVQRLVRIALIAGVLAAALALHFAHGYAFWEGHILIGIWVAGLLAAAAIGIWLASRRPSGAVAGHLGYRQVMLLAIALSVLILSATQFKQPDTRFFVYNKAHTFSIILPKGMAEDAKGHAPEKGAESDTTDMRLLFLTDGKKLPNLAVAALVRPRFRHPGDPMPTLNELLNARSVSPITVQLSAPDTRGWRSGIAQAHNLKSGKPLNFVFFKREVETETASTEADWYVICGTPARGLAKTRAMCEQVKRSFRPEVAARPSRKAAMVLDLVFFAAAAAAFALAAVRSRRKQEPVLDLVAWVLLLAALNGIGGYAFGGADETLFNTRFTTDLLTAVLLAAGVVGLAIEAWPRSRAAGFETAGTRSVAARLNATLLIIAGVLYLYVFAASQAEESQAVRGLVVFLALTWELATAGATVNQHGSGYAFPRTSRILIFVGYLILVATCVFMFGVLDAPFLATRMGAFNTEAIVAGGLVLIGAAFAITQALRSLPSLRRAPVYLPPDNSEPGAQREPQ
jgi:hypothetical protein